MDVCVIGAGYVGLVTGSCLAYFGNKVTVVDSNGARIKELKQGKVPFFEPGLAELLENVSASHFLEFTQDLASAVQNSKVVFIAVGTPSLESGEPDLSQITAVASAIGAALDGKHRRIIVNKSTVPVGSGNWVEMLVSQGMTAKVTEKALAPVGKGGSGITEDSASYSVVSNPEFLREGSAIADTLFPDRIVIGSNDECAISLMKELYRPIIQQDFKVPSFLKEQFDTSANSHNELKTPDSQIPFIVTDLTSAELIKYAANAFLALKISFANEMAGLCEKAGADIREVVKGIGLDKRIGQHFLNAGIGWGGSCFGKDVRALIESAKEYNYPTPLLESTLMVNERQRKVLIAKLQDELKIIKGRTIGLMGLSFKPNTDDLRDAPSLTIASQLLKMGAFVKAYDPVSNAICAAQHPELSLKYCDNLLELATNCDALLLITEWDDFKHVNWQEIARVMRSPLVIDGRNVLQESQVQAAGIIYRGIGH